MDGLDALFYILVLLFILTVGYLHVKTLLQKKEGFDVPAKSSQSTSPTPSDVEKKIRAALDPYLDPDFCDVYTQLRAVVAQNIQGNTLKPTEETLQKVATYLAREITLTPLPCPVFTYPTGTELEWLVFLNGLPTDIGAKYVLMCVYAQREMKFRADNLKIALDRGTPVPDEEKDAAETKRIADKIILSALPTEGFTSIIGICPATVQDTRRMERKHAGCLMPDDMTHEEIVQSVNNILQKMSDDKKSILREKYISPDLDVKPFLQDAKVNSDYLKKMSAKALDGSLIYEMSSPSEN
jgi:hypothetical protein